MVKLLILDLDGTLLTSDKRIADCDKKAITRALDSGVEITIFTGRNFHSALPYIEELGVEVPVVFQNGALVYDFSKKESVLEIRLDGDMARTVVDRAKKENVYAVVYTDFFSRKDMLVESDYEGPFKAYFESNSWRITRVDDLKKAVPETVVEVALIGHEDSISSVVSDLDGVSVIKGSMINGESFYEIFGPNCSKGEALEFVLEYFGISREDVAFIGDGYNDVEIMKKVGLPIAMGNAPEDVKSLARFVTSGNDECGVARAIEKFVLHPL